MKAETMPRAILGTIFAEATVAEDGSLHLNSPASGFKPGERVRLIISPILNDQADVQTQLRGSVVRYDDPFGPAAPTDDWEALKGC